MKQTEVEVPCPYCNGSGKTQDLSMDLLLGMGGNMMNCPYCYGSGKVERK